MDLPILVTQQPTGFRAATGSPFDLSADGPTADAAVAMLRALVAAKVQSGEVRTITLANALGKWGEPWSDEFVQAIEEYRRIHNTVPEEDE